MMPKSPLRYSLGLAALAFFAFPASSFATVTLMFVSAGVYATNWADGSGAGGSALAWGIIVDGDGDGLASSYMTAGVDYSAITAPAGRVPQELRDGTGALTGDVLFMSPITMSIVPSPSSGADGIEAGQNRITTIASIPLLPGFDIGAPFYVAWFDSAAAPVSAPSGMPEVGEKFGIFGHSSFTLPGDGGTLSYSSAFVGVDPLKQMTHTWVPEPASAMLSLLGALGLLRRRR